MKVNAIGGVWCLVRYLHPVDHYPGGIIKVYRLFGDKLDIKDIKFPVKIKVIHKIEKNNSISISAFGHENKVKYSIYMSKKRFEEKPVDLLLIEEEGKWHYVFIKDFNTFIYDHTLRLGKKTFLLLLVTSF